MEINIVMYLSLIKKISALDRKIDAFLDYELDSRRSGIVLSQEIEKIELFSKGIEDCKNFLYGSLVIVDPKYIEINSLAG